MSTPKLPTEAELAAIPRALRYGTLTEEGVNGLLALGREYYALRRKLREWSPECLKDAIKLAALLGEDAQ